MKTLIVDDEPANRTVLHSMLAPFGQCDEVENGIKAINAFKMAYSDKQPYDLICLDIMMPEMDGQEVLKQIRRLEKEWKLSMKETTTIIMVSALDTEESVLEAFYQGGCTAYIPKPVTKEKLLKKLQNLRLIPKA